MADRAIRQTTMSMVAVVWSMLLGSLWVVMLVLLLGDSLEAAISWRLLPGALGGLCGGYLTLRSRSRRQGREHIGDGVLAYYAAVLTYALASVMIGAITDAVADKEGLGILMLLAAAWAACVSTVVFATVMGVVFVPLCFATRLLFWRIASRMRNN